MTSRPQKPIPRLRLGVLHYHWRRCGVTTVVNNALRAVIAHVPCDHLEIDLISSDAGQSHSRTMLDGLRRFAQQFRPESCIINAVELPTLAYNDTPAATRSALFDQASHLTDLLLGSLRLKCSTADNPYILHVHNANLGKNPRLTLALKLLADRIASDHLPVRILYQMHDFAEDKRPDCWAALKNCSGSSDPELAVEMMYPASRHIHWVTINSADRQRLLSVPLAPKSITVLPNAVDVETFQAPPLSEMSAAQLRELSLPQTDYTADLKHRIATFAQTQGFHFNADRKILLAPIKTIRRKNVAESVLLLRALNHQDDRWQLLITLQAGSPADVEYCRVLQDFVKQHQLPVTLGFGGDVLRAGHQRLIENGRVLAYSLIDMLAASDAVVTTSIQEGFGYIFHEPWLAGKPLIGRNIPRVTADFTATGLRLDHLYDHLLIRRECLVPHWDAIRQAYVKKLNSTRQAMGLPPYPLAEAAALIDRQKSYACSPSAPEDPSFPATFVDFADLGLPEQLSVIKQLIDDDNVLSDIRWTDSNLHPLSHWQNTSISGIIGTNSQAVAASYDLEISGQRLARLFAGGWPSAADVAPRRPIYQRSNEVILAEALEIETLRLLA